MYHQYNRDNNHISGKSCLSSETASTCIPHSQTLLLFYLYVLEIFVIKILYNSTKLCTNTGVSTIQDSVGYRLPLVTIISE